MKTGRFAWGSRRVASFGGGGGGGEGGGGVKEVECVEMEMCHRTYTEELGMS